MSLPIAKKSFGQNFLIDELVVKKIAIAADIQKGETVLEIGPGTGLLTSALIRYGAKVIAIELDHDFIDPLEEKFGDQIELVEGDVLKLHPLPVQDGAFKLVANIPYNITSPILEKFLAHGPHPTVMILMVQKEVADRIVAEPPQMSLLSVMCQLYAKCSRVLVVKAGSFRPIPKVDSAVVRFELLKPIPQAERVIALAKAGFVSRRKQLHHNLLPFARITNPEMDAQKIKTILLDAHLDPKVRAENLTIHDWINLEAMIQ
jgi:16S rRNA (adenine1518-N6/adenine1519-N6)-dimethyltransferase